MALPVLTKTWQFSVNNSTGLGLGTGIDINRTCLRTVKDQLLSFASSPWTMRYSCNSVTAGTAGDGVDRLTTNANFVWANAGTAHSWMVLLQTGVSSNYQLLLSCETTTGNGNTLTIYASPNNGFTGGTTTTRPTATDEIGINTGTAVWNSGSVTAIRWHALMTTDGQCTRIVFCQANAIISFLSIEKPGSPVSGWNNPSATCGNNYTSGVMSAVALGGLTVGYKALIGATTANLSVSAEAVITSVASSSFPTNASWGLTANQVSGEWPMLPTGMISTTSPVYGRHGTFQDMWVGSGGANSGDTYPAGASNQFAQFGALIFPWNGTAVLLT